MLYKKIIGVYFENRKNNINIFWRSTNMLLFRELVIVVTTIFQRVGYVV